MASTYSNLKFELIGTGDQSGTWGTTTNTNLGTAIEQAIVGMATISSGFVTNSLTLTLTDTNAAQNARALVLNLTQALSGAGTLNVPAIQKPYMIINATGQTVTVKVTGLTGVAVPTGTRAFLYNNGTDVGDFFNYASSLTLGTDLAIADGGTGASTAPNARTNLGATTVGSNLFTLTNPSAITFLRINADNTVSALDAATFRTAIGAGTTSGAAGSNTQVQYNNSGAFAGSSNLTFDGTSLTLGGNPTLSAGTANGVLYLNGSKVATSGSALTFNGATFTAPFVQASDANASVKADGNGVAGIRIYANSVGAALLETTTDTDLTFRRNSAEGMRLTSTGLGIGTSSVTNPLTIVSATATTKLSSSTTTNQAYHSVTNASGNMYFGINNSANSFFAAAAYAGIVWHDGAYPIVFGTSNTERMRLDSSGNVGIGVTPPTVSQGRLLSLAYSGSGISVTSGTSLDLTDNAYYNTAWKYGQNGLSARFQLTDDQFIFFNATTGTAGNNITWSERMRINASGNVGIGTSSPAVKLSFGTQFAGNNGYANAIRLYDDGSASTSQTSNSYGFGFIDTGSLSYTSGTGGNHRFFTGNTERVRIATSGGFSVGTTADPGAGAIYATGAITAYYSDCRLKDVKGTITDALDKVSSLSGVFYTNNEVAVAHGYTSAETQVGLLAQDVEAVLPEVVKAAPFDLDEKGNSKSGEHYKTIQYERIIPLLVEAIKELRAEIQALRG